jgi:hypothetical protein
MRLQNFLLIFAVGILIGAFAVWYFGAAGTVASPDPPKGLERPEPPPPPIARAPDPARPAPPPPAPPKPAEAKAPRTPVRNRVLEPWLEEAQVRRSFDDSRLEATECFSSDEIARMRSRWEEFQEQRRDLVGRVNRGDPARGGAEWSELQLTLREALGDAGYNGLLYATGQTNSVRLADLPRGSRAAEAGLRQWDQILSYDGVQIYERSTIEELTLGEFPEHRVEIEVHHTDYTTETLLIEPGPLGVRLTVASRLSPCRDR